MESEDALQCPRTLTAYLDTLHILITICNNRPWSTELHVIKRKSVIKKKSTRKIGEISRFKDLLFSVKMLN